MIRHRRLHLPLLVGAALVLGTSAPAASASESVPMAVAIEQRSTAPGPAIGFDPDQPFTIVESSRFFEPHVDTIDGEPASADEIAAVEAANDSTPLPPGVAGLSAGTTHSWRNPANPDDPPTSDVLLHARTDVPDEVVAIVGDVFAEYRTIIDLDVPSPEWHHVDITWSTTLPAGVLGGAATGWSLVNQNGALFWIPGFLANVNGAPTAANAPVMDLVLNANIDWDMNRNPSDAEPNPSYYLKTVLLHEVGHALGIASGVGNESSIPSATLSSWGLSFFGAQDESQSFRLRRGSVVKQNNLWARNSDGTWERLYDPTVWEQGSSLSHLDENTYRYSRGRVVTPGALMTPFLTNGEVNRPDGVVAGLLSQIGFRTFLSPAAPSVSAVWDTGTLEVGITPQDGSAMSVPAKSWTVQVYSPSGALLRTALLPATERVRLFGGFTEAGVHQVRVTASIDGQSTAAAPVGVAVTPQPQTTIAASTSIYGLIFASDYTIGDADTLRLYRAFFRREPDIGGAKYWLGLRRSGVPYDVIAGEFAVSAEFALNYGNVTDRQFLEIVYSNVLGRTPDSAGFDYWFGEMRRGLSRGLVVRWVAAGAEFTTAYPYRPE